MDKRDPAELEFQQKTRKLKGHDLIAHQLNGIRLAIIQHSENTGKWLGAVALAASTPSDNSAEVKEYTERIKLQVDALKSAAQQPKGE